MTVDIGAPLPLLPEPLPHAGDTSPCRRHACTLCCHDTEMPLLPEDVARLAQATGQEAAEFSVAGPGDGDRVLRNRDGRCVFLGPDGCTVYTVRPAGCRLYPLVLDEETGQGILDEDCPYRSSFRIGRRDRQALRDLVDALDPGRA